MTGPLGGPRLPATVVPSPGPVLLLPVVADLGAPDARRRTVPAPP